MTQIRLHITKEKLSDLTWEQVEIITLFQLGSIDTAALLGLRGLISAFMVNKKGVPIRREIAMGRLGKLSGDQVKETVKLFGKELKSYAVPKENGEQLSQPSDTEEEALGGSGS